MAKITGDFKHIRHLLEARGPLIQREVGQAIFVAGDLVAKEAARSIVSGSVSGRAHVPSAPGTPPNADTRNLDTNIFVERHGLFAVNVVSAASYSTFLEFGTSKMAERPFMKPAADKMTPKAVKLVEAALKRAIGGL